MNAFLIYYEFAGDLLVCKLRSNVIDEETALKCTAAHDCTVAQRACNAIVNRNCKKL